MRGMAVALLFKKGDRRRASQYRPVAVLACDFKVAALWWVHKRNRWIRDGGRDTRRVPTTVADWARKWSGLFRPRDERACSSGFDARGWVVTTWPVRSDARQYD